MSRCYLRITDLRRHSSNNSVEENKLEQIDKGEKN